MPANSLFEDKRLVELLYETGGSIAQCAKVLGVAIPSVYSRIQRTKSRALKKAYSKIQRKKKSKADLLNRRFGFRLVIAKGHMGEQGHQYWVCQCDCGDIKEVSASYLLNGRSHKCLKCTILKHGKARGTTRPPEYNAWQNMLQRCFNPNCPEYHNYGKRGIIVCDEYKNDFMRFFNDLGQKPSSLHSLERIDNEKGYEVGNIKWETAEAQTNNRRTTLSVDGEKISCIKLADSLGMNRETVRFLINEGATMEEMKEYTHFNWHERREFNKKKKSLSR